MSKNIPLNAIRAFVEAGNHKSFTRAADSLNVSQGAVSQQVAKLEVYLGMPLFERLPKGLELTEAGARYHAWVADSIESLAEATLAIRELNLEQTLAVTTLNSFASHWLMPRLPRFQTRHPEVQLRIETSMQPLDLSERRFDAGIRRGPGRWRGLRADRLFSDSLAAVTTPAYSKSINMDLGPAALASVPLFHDPGDPSEWPRWFDAAGCSSRRLQLAHGFTDSLVLLSAIKSGVPGVALLSNTLIHAELQAGTLVRLFDTEIPVLHPYYLVYPDNRRPSRAFEAFREWLLEEVQTADS